MAANSPRKTTLGGSLYLRSTIAQLVVTLLLACITFIGADLFATGSYPVGFLADKTAMLSLLYGALCAVLPQAFFALRMQQAARRSARHAARLGLAAEGGKFLLSAASFALVFAVLKPERPGLVFLGFGVLWLVQLIVSVRMLSR